MSNGHEAVIDTPIGNAIHLHNEKSPPWCMMSGENPIPGTILAGAIDVPRDVWGGGRYPPKKVHLILIWVIHYSGE